MGFSKPMVTTRNGRPSDSRTMFNGTPSLVVTIRAKRNAKTEEKRTEIPSHAFEPSRRIERKSETKVKCMEI